MRPSLALLHRWVGLAIAGFLALVGTTGALLVWNHELDLLATPQPRTLSGPAVNGAALDALAIRTAVERTFPSMEVVGIPLHHRTGESLIVDVAPAIGLEAEFDQVFVDPADGRTLGTRRYGDISQGWVNAMPFILRLHSDVTWGDIGSYTLGIVALLWTVDCFVGVCLTLPAGRASSPGVRKWFRRWRPSWAVRTGVGKYKLNFDLHRASGLWLWVMLFVIAWSAVAFNLPEVYTPVTRFTLGMQSSSGEVADSASPASRPDSATWASALAEARRRMKEATVRHGFSVQREAGLYWDRSRGLWRYYVESSLDVSSRQPRTQLLFDLNDPARQALVLPTAQSTGDTVTTWLKALHTAAVFGMPYRLFVSLMGVAVVGLSLTGLYVWWHKLRARRRAPGRSNEHVTGRT
jgi:uncharacterized iron-regulated membrane protein